MAKSETIVWLVFRLLVSLVPRLNLFATRSFKQRIKIDVTTRSSQLVTRLSHRLLAGLYCLIKTIPINLSLETREVISLARQKRRGIRFYREYSRTTTSSIVLLVLHKSSISPTPPPCDCFRFIPRSCSLLSLEPWTVIRSVNRLGWFISMDVPLPVVDGINKNQ